MLNPRVDRLPDYPFDRLRALLNPIAPPTGMAPLALSVGEPQHPTPAIVAETLAANAHLWGKYPPIEGTPEFRAAVARWLKRRYALPDGFLDADNQILPLAGTREGLYLIADLAVAERRPNGSRPAVLMPSPFYHVYGGAAAMSGADPVYLPAGRETGFLPDLDAIPEDVLGRAALLFLCSPANPQGAIADAAYLEKAIRLAQRFDFVLAMDECYAEIYDKEPPPGALGVCAGYDLECRNVVVFHSLSKRSSAPGLRSGFVAGDRELMVKFRRLRSYAATAVPLPIVAASTALWLDESHVEANRALYRIKFDLAQQYLGDHPGFHRPGGGFFLWLDVGNGEDAAKRLWSEAAIRVLPGEYLAAPTRAGEENPGKAFVRMALVHDPETTRQALARIVKVL